MDPEEEARQQAEQDRLREAAAQGVVAKQDKDSMDTIRQWYHDAGIWRPVSEAEVRSHMRGSQINIGKTQFYQAALAETNAYSDEDRAAADATKKAANAPPPTTPPSTTPPPPGTGYNLEKLKAAWLGAAGRYEPTAAGLAKFVADNSGPGGFAEGVTVGGSKKNKLYLGNESSGTFLADVIRGTSGSNPAHDWDTSIGGGSAITTAATTASTAETPAQRSARLASFGLGPNGLQNQRPGEMPPAPRLGDMMGQQGPIANPGTYTPGAAYQAPEYRAPDPYQVATPFGRPEYQAAMPFVAPTAADMGQDPGYQFRLSEGQKALERSGAARGVTNTGGNMKGLLDYGQQAASQEYGNVYNRNLNTYNTNEANRASAYQTNYGNALNAYNMNEGNRAGAYNTNANNAYQQYTTNALAGNTYNQDTEARQSGAFGTNTNLYQQQQTDAYNRSQQAYNDAMAAYQTKINNQRQYERDRMSDIQYAAGA